LYKDISCNNNNNICTGTETWPGAKTVRSVARGRDITLDACDSSRIAQELSVGDMVERHLVNDDVVLFNRQPSLHKMSIMAHRVKVMPWRTFRFNECVCNPYNADFDGDEMNLHVPQTEEARAEAACLMDVRKNLITPKDGSALVSATQDFLTASYLLTQRDTFMTREEFCNACTFATDARAHIEIPRPAVFYPVKLWTGKQLFSVLIQNALNGKSVSVELKEKNFEPSSDGTAHDVMCPRDGYVVIDNSKLLSGNLCKTTLGSSKKGLVFALARDINEDTAARFLGMMTKSMTRWLTSYGFSIGIDDVTPSAELGKFKKHLIQERYKKCADNIKKFKDGTLQLQPGCNAEESLEAELSSILNKVREMCGDNLMRTLPKHNATLCMATCGSKGSPLNICQMMAAVGQQIVNGERVAEGYVERTLPHFSRNDKAPEAKGFVSSSFYDGLSATEFFFHTQGGREGLVDTAVKTAETGYMQRRLMKALEDLSLQYDGTVRTSGKSIIQFQFGDDGLNPSFMESNSRPVNFDRLLSNRKRKPSEQILTPSEILKMSNEFKSSKKMKTIYESNDKIKCEIDSFLKKIHENLSNTATEKMWRRIQSGNVKTEKEILLRNTNALSKQQLEDVFARATEKFIRAHQEPGEAVGAIAAMSIGEPATQMTLKTFHFSGVASMDITMGVRTFEVQTS
jgi:DNA-directed RNA polymerase III subunit RPC1